MLLDKCAARWTRLVALAALATLTLVAELTTCRAAVEPFHELAPDERVFLARMSLGQKVSNLTSAVLERLYEPSRTGFTEVGGLSEMSHLLARLKISQSREATFLAIDLNTGRIAEHPLTLGVNDTEALENTWRYALKQRAKHLLKLPLEQIMLKPTVVSFDGVQYRQPKPAVFGVSLNDYDVMAREAVALNQRDGVSLMALGIPLDWRALEDALYEPELVKLAGGHMYSEVYRTHLKTPRTIEGTVQLAIKADGRSRREPVPWPFGCIASFQPAAEPGAHQKVYRTVPIGTKIAVKVQALRLQGGGVGNDTKLCSTLSELDALARMQYLQVHEISDLTPATLGIYFTTYQPKSEQSKRFFFVTDLEWIDGRPLINVPLAHAAIVELLYGEWAMANFAGLNLHDRHGYNYIVQNVTYDRVIQIGTSAALCIPRNVPMVRRIDLGISSLCKWKSCAARACKDDGSPCATRPPVDPRFPVAQDARILESARLTEFDDISVAVYSKAREKVRVGIPPLGIEHTLDDLRLLERQFTADRLLRLWSWLPQNHESDIWLDYLLRKGPYWDEPVVRALYALYLGASFPSVVEAFFPSVLCNEVPLADSVPGVRVYSV